MIYSWGFKSLSSYHNGWLAQLVRALAWRARGHRFESYITHQLFYCWGENENLKNGEDFIKEENLIEITEYLKNKISK